MTPIFARTAPEEHETTPNGIPSAEIRSQLDRILCSRAFLQSHRIRRFLQFVVEESLLGQPHRLKEYLIGLEVFERRDAFDPRVDSIVRVEARRLRSKLEEYYRTDGRDDSVRIVLRKGSYVPFFEYRTIGAAPRQAMPRPAVEVGSITLVNPPAGAQPVIDEIQRRIAHVLIKEGGFRVVLKPAGENHRDSAEGNGHSTHPDYVLEGSVEFRPEGYHVTLQVSQASDGSYIFSETADLPVDDLAGVDRIVQLLLQELASSAHSAGAARRHTTHKESADWYLQGRYYWKLSDPDSIRHSVTFFAKAVEADENYAAAWAALSEALLVSSMFGFLQPKESAGRMREAAQRAAALNPRLPEAHVALGAVSSLLDWDWTTGEQELEKAILLDNHDPVGHVAYGIQLACRGHVDRALTEVERALELDPASLFPNFVLGWLYGVSHRFGEATAQHQLVARFAPDYGLAHLGLGLACAGQGLYTDAIAHLTNASQMKCRSLLHGLLGFCYAMAGRREEALREAGVLGMRADLQYVSPVSLAAIHAGLGEPDRALEYLESAVLVQDTSLPVHLLNPEFDSLRGDPRFENLRRRIGLLAPEPDAAIVA